MDSTHMSTNERILKIKHKNDIIQAATKKQKDFG